MSGYHSFAAYYDILTGNISYPERGGYFHSLLQKFGRGSGILLDLACGTGSLSEVMAGFGWDVIGVDSSPDMLAEAMDKKYRSGKDILYLCQDMRELDLYGTIDACVCALDSLNHLTREEDLRRVFERVSLFLAPGGLFLFDVNTLYKHEKILAGNVFVYDMDEVYCVWQNSPCRDGLVEFTLDFFECDGDGLYRRECETFAERAYSDEALRGLLAESGMDFLACYDADGFAPPTKDAQRTVYVARSGKRKE